MIAVLISLLLPSLSSAREAAKATVCASGLRQVGTATVLYAEDYDDYLVPPYDGEEQNRWNEPKWFPQLLAPYVDYNWNIFNCPSAEETLWLGSEGKSTKGWYLGTYAINANIARQKRMAMSSGFGQALKQIFMVDGRAMFKASASKLANVGISGSLRGRHMGNNSYLMLDTHVESASKQAMSFKWRSNQEAPEFLVYLDQ